jgi:hypothetical protein
MDLDDQNWRRWPAAGGASFVSETEPGEAYEPPGTSPADLVQSAVGALRGWGVSDDKIASDTSGGSAITRDNMWRHYAAHPLVLLLRVLDMYGEDVVQWSPDTLKTTLERDGFSLAGTAFTKLMAARVLLASPSPWRQWEVFHWVSVGLAGIPPNFTYWEEPSINHFAVCADLMGIVDPKRQTSTEVDKYVATFFRHEGIHFIPTPLSFAQRELEQPQVRCKACDAIHRDDNDTKCVTCGKSELEKIPYIFAASSAETAKLWDQRHKFPVESAVDGLPDTAPGNAVYRLLVEWDAVTRSRRGLLQQLRLLGG